MIMQGCVSFIDHFLKGSIVKDFLLHYYLYDLIISFVNSREK